MEFEHQPLKNIYIYFLKGKLHFTTLNYALDYTLHLKLSDYTLCTLNYHTYHTLHFGVIFAVIFNRILLHVTSTCFLLRWNKVKRLKHPSPKSIKTKPNFFTSFLVVLNIWGSFRKKNILGKKCLFPLIK